MIEVNRLMPGCLRSTNKIGRRGWRGVHVGIIGDMSHDTGKSALGARHELDAGWTVAKREGDELEGIGVDVYFKRAPHQDASVEAGKTDLDVYFSRDNLYHAVQVKDSSNTDLLGELSRWCILSCRKLDESIDEPLAMLARLEFMFPPKLGITEEVQRAADLKQVANTLMKHKFFEDVPAAE
jgi:hypothetical protein